MRKMRAVLRHVLQQLAPPIVVTVVRRISSRRLGTREWEFTGYEWPDARRARGWNVSSVVDVQRSRWPGILEAIQRPGLLTESGLVPHNTLPCFGYVVGRASVGRSRLSLLDGGGGLGQYGLIARGLFPDLELEYHCHDLPLMTDAGRGLLPGAYFHENEAETFAGTYDLVMASGSLQYVKEWSGTLTRLAGSTGRYLYVTRQPFVRNSRSFVVLQRPSAYGYETEYPGWVLDRREFLAPRDRRA